MESAKNYPLARWMGDLVDRNSSKGRGCGEETSPTLKLLVMPATHDSASYSIPNSTCFSSIGHTQTLTIREQLLAGVRFFDLRIAAGRGRCKNGGNNSSSSSGVCIYHGRLMGCPLEEVLDEIKVFCQEFPTEFVVLHGIAEFGRPFPPAAKQRALDLFHEALGAPSDDVDKRLLCQVDSRNRLLNTPLPELIRENGRVCVLFSSRIYKEFWVDGVNYDAEFVQEEYGFHESTQWLWNKWHDTMEAKGLEDGNLDEIQFHKATKRRYFVSSQFVLTPALAGNYCGIFQRGTKALQPLELTKTRLYEPTDSNSLPFIHQFFLDHYREDWNLIMLDFVDLVPSLVQLLIGMNFGELDIKLAVLGNGKNRRQKRGSGLDVTDLVQPKVLRKRCLFLHPRIDFKSLLDDDVNETSCLTLVYKIGKKMYSIVMPLGSSWNSNATMPIVLSEQNHLRLGGTELSIGKGKQGNGTIEATRNSGGVTLTWQKTEMSQSFRFNYLDEMDS